MSFDTTSMPAHARVVANDDVWMEGDGVAQFARTAALPGCVSAAAMPDLHVGKGPIGAVFATRDRIYPHLLGGDVGCGVRLVPTAERTSARDRVERRVRRVWDEEPLAASDGDALFEAAVRMGAPGLALVEGLPDALRALAALEPGGAANPRHVSAGFELRVALGLGLGHGLEQGLGSVGGGNHFAEIARVDEVRDTAAAEALGLERGRLCVLVHSGSRALGSVIERRFGNATLAGAGLAPYLAAVAAAKNFAAANRFVLAYRLLVALGAARPSKVARALELTHNDVASEPLAGAPAWIHRKGAAPARAGQATVVLGSRGAPSWVMIGTGSERGLASVAHGAGRRMGRAEARDKLGHKYRRSELVGTALGGRVVCDDTNLLYEEHPDAYKPIEPVVRTLIEAELATPVAALVPVITVKR